MYAGRYGARGKLRALLPQIATIIQQSLDLNDERKADIEKQTSALRHKIDTGMRTIKDKRTISRVDADRVYAECHEQLQTLYASVQLSYACVEHGCI
jgi:hypothetical protein